MTDSQGNVPHRPRIVDLQQRSVAHVRRYFMNRYHLWCSRRLHGSTASISSSKGRMHLPSGSFTTGVAPPSSFLAVLFLPGDFTKGNEERPEESPPGAAPEHAGCLHAGCLMPPLQNDHVRIASPNDGSAGLSIRRYARASFCFEAVCEGGSTAR